ncbi:MAG: HAD-IA family hydrolase, partial [Methylococcaceae bacterium]|nr:HAD-IA family hydrolase [Methylococcaceae bacterium]
MSGAKAETLPQALAEAIEAASVVTFDIFDTALVRAIENPVDLFLLLAHEAQLPDGSGFARARVAAERVARQRGWESRRAAEVTLEEIYAVLAEYPEAAALDLHTLMLRECELELRVSQRHPVIGQAYEQARQLGKRVGFISDMYLDTPLIAAMLDKCGYVDYDFLQVSSAAGKTKASGELYAHVRDRHALDPARHLHIGDNWHSDIQQAIAAGLKTYHIRKNADHLPKTPVGKRFKRRSITPASLDGEISREAGDGIWQSLWRGLSASHTARQSQGFWHDLGYTHVGMLLLGFGLWLERMARETGVSHLYFLARDGHIMHRVHQLLRDQGLAQVPGSYLYASRRAWNVPALMDIDEQACDFLVSGTSRLMVGEFLSRVGLDVKDALPLIHAAGFRDPGQRVRNGRDYGRLRALFRSLAPALLELAREERAILADYWGQEKVFEQAHIGLVDIGWHGSLQDSFLKLMARFGRGTPVTGFYLGTYAAATARVAAGARQFAFLCEG